MKRIITILIIIFISIPVFISSGRLDVLNSYNRPYMIDEIVISARELDHKEQIEAIKSFEGFRSHAYKCVNGVLTIGHGLTKYFWNFDRKTITEAESSIIVTKIYYQFKRIVEKEFPNSQYIDVLTHMAYWMGVAKMKRVVSEDGNSLTAKFDQFRKYKKRHAYILNQFK